MNCHLTVAEKREADEGLPAPDQDSARSGTLILFFVDFRVAEVALDRSILYI